MRPAMQPLSRAQSRRIDQLAIVELGLPGIVLMENAARGLADLADEFAGQNDAPIRICCGPGNNGGDGLAMARWLANSGRAVVLHLAVDSYPEHSDAGVHDRVCRAMGIPRSNEPPEGPCALAVDALFGTGLDRPILPPIDRFVTALNSLEAPVLAVDIPSGLDADTGAPHGIAVRATLTGTMVAPKAGFEAPEAQDHIGEVRVIDIGVPPELVRRVREGA